MRGRLIKALWMVLLCLTTYTIGAQSHLETVDVVKTTAGSIWKGTVTEITADGYYVMQTISGLELRLHQSTVVNVRQVWVGQRGMKKQYNFREKGVYHVIELGLNGNSTGPGMGLTYAAGYRFNRFLGVGAGTGIEGYELGWGLNVVPVFAEIRGFILPKKVTPYYALRAGYGFALKNDLNGVTEADGGYMVNPQVGVRFGGGSRVSFFTGLGVHIQKASYTRSFPWNEEINTDKYLFRRIEMKFGITF